MRIALLAAALLLAQAGPSTTMIDADMQAIWDKVGVKDGREAARKTQEPASRRSRCSPIRRRCSR